ncbi:MAG: hypothetical protein FJX62_24775 [Alphaproteobacteria bacterium]|nr:hypothetical protein [Alphaproteobacteria bacterium]
MTRRTCTAIAAVLLAACAAGPVLSDNARAGQAAQGQQPPAQPPNCVEADASFQPAKTYTVKLNNRCERRVRCTVNAYIVTSFGPVTLTAQFFVAPLVLHSDQAVSHEPVEQNLYSTQEQRYIFRGFGYEIIVPFSGSQGLFRMQPHQSIFPPPRAFVNEDGLSIRIVADVGAELVKAETKEIIDSIERVIAFQNVQLSQFNESIAPLARADIGRRKSSILEAKQIAASLGFPMRLRADAPATYTSPTVRRRLPIVLKTIETFVPESEMHESDYQNVLKIIENMTLVMERSPRIFSKMPEEVMRDHYLVQLNGQYESATGETFNAYGKTDILVRDRGRNIFIAECKIWRGPQSVTEALDQLLTY